MLEVRIICYMQVSTGTNSRSWNVVNDGEAVNVFAETFLLIRNVV
jgi:hypothetical protein